MASEGPDSKRQRLEHVTAAAAAADAGGAPADAQHQQQQSPWVTSLFQVPAGLPKEPSPGAMHGCRIVTWFDAAVSSSSTYGSVLASGRNVYCSQLLVQQQQLQTEQVGKEGVLLPLRLQAPAVQQLQLPHHAGEVQSLALCSSRSSEHPGEMLLATVDAYGAGSISRLRPAQQYAAAAKDAESAAAAAAAAGPAAAPEVVVQSAIRPMDPCREGGWAGVTFSGSGSNDGSSSNGAAAAAPSLLATARGFAKDICVYDVTSGKALRSFACVQNPYALTFLPSGVLSGNNANILAVAEGHAVALYDVRAAGAAGGCMQRFSPGALGQPLYTLAWTTAQAGLLGAAGAERSLFLTEPRKWRVVNKWHGATRLAIHHLSFLECDSRYAVLSGLDLEVVIGRWDSPGSNARPFESQRPADEAAAAAAGGGGEAGGQGVTVAEGASGGGKVGSVGGVGNAAPGAPGSGDRSRKGGNAAVAAAAVPGGMDLDEGEGAAAAGVLSFRGDGRWLGVSKAVGADVLAGFAASGNLVYARIA